MFNSQSKPELNRYILDFFRKCNLSGTAESFEKESDVEVEEVVDTPQGFLYEWWQVFWDIFNTTTNRGGSETAQSYFKLVLQQQRQEHIYRSLAIHAARMQHIAEQRGDYDNEETDPMLFAMMLANMNSNPQREATQSSPSKQQQQQQQQNTQPQPQPQSLSQSQQFQYQKQQAMPLDYNQMMMMTMMMPEYANMFNPSVASSQAQQPSPNTENQDRNSAGKNTRPASHIDPSAYQYSNDTNSPNMASPCNTTHKSSIDSISRTEAGTATVTATPATLKSSDPRPSSNVKDAPTPQHMGTNEAEPARRQDPAMWNSMNPQMYMPFAPGMFMMNPQQLQFYMEMQKRAQLSQNFDFTKQAHLNGRNPAFGSPEQMMMAQMMSSPMFDMSMMNGFQMPPMSAMGQLPMTGQIPSWYMQGAPFFNGSPTMEQFNSMMLNGKTPQAANAFSSMAQTMNMQSSPSPKNMGKTKMNRNSSSPEDAPTLQQGKAQTLQKSQVQPQLKRTRSSSQRSPDVPMAKAREISTHGSPNIDEDHALSKYSNNSLSEGTPGTSKVVGTNSPAYHGASDIHSSTSRGTSPDSNNAATPLTGASRSAKSSSVRSKSKTPATQPPKKKRKPASQGVTTPKTMVVTPVLTSSVNQNGTPVPTTIGDEQDLKDDMYDHPSVGNTSIASKKSTISPRDEMSSESNQTPLTGSLPTPLESAGAMKLKRLAKSVSAGVSPNVMQSPTSRSVASETNSPRSSQNTRKISRRKSTPMLHEHESSDPTTIRKAISNVSTSFAEENLNHLTPPNSMNFNGINVMNYTNKPALSSPLSTVPESCFGNDDHDAPQKDTNTDNQVSKMKSHSQTPSSFTKFQDNNADNAFDSNINSHASTNSNDHIQSQMSPIDFIPKNDGFHASPDSNKHYSNSNSHSDINSLANNDSKIDFGADSNSHMSNSNDSSKISNNLYKFSNQEDLLFFDSMFGDPVVSGEQGSHNSMGSPSKEENAHGHNLENHDGTSDANILLETNDTNFHFMD